MPSGPDYPLATAVAAYAQMAHQFDLTGSLDGVTFTMNYSYTPGPPGTFEGHPASTALKQMTLSANGMSDQYSAVSYFSVNPYREYGSIDQIDGTYAVMNQTNDLPATAKVGQSGPLGTEVDYADSSKSTVVGTAAATWSLEADTATTALFCVNAGIDGGASGSGSECYRLDTSGVVSGMVVKVNVDGKTLTLR